MTAHELTRKLTAPVEIPELHHIALGHAVMRAHEWRAKRGLVWWQRQMADIALEEQCGMLMAARERDVEA